VAPDAKADSKDPPEGAPSAEPAEADALPVPGASGTKPVPYTPFPEEATLDSGGAPRRQTRPPPEVVSERPRPRPSAAQVGDAEGEYRAMRRGGVRAWPAVFLAFALEAAALGAIVRAAATAVPVGWLVDGFVAWALGAVGAFGVFHDRWRCIEAFASAHLRGAASWLYAPFIAFGYANLRAVRKFAGR
jgi:hypothetical protein